MHDKCTDGFSEAKTYPSLIEYYGLFIRESSACPIMCFLQHLRDDKIFISSHTTTCPGELENMQFLKISIDSDSEPIFWKFSMFSINVVGCGNGRKNHLVLFIVCCIQF